MRDRSRTCRGGNADPRAGAVRSMEVRVTFEECCRGALGRAKELADLAADPAGGHRTVDRPAASMGTRGGADDAG